MEPFRIRHTVPDTPSLSVIKTMVKDMLDTGWVTNAKYVKEFERSAAEYLGVKHAIAVSSCTSGMMLVLKALGITGRVAIPSYTFSATAHAVAWCGLTPVLVDCNPNTYNIDALKIPEDVNAILGVHVFGNPCEAVQLDFVSGDWGIPLIYDAAHAFGASYLQEKVGNFGIAEVFSLAPTKICFGCEGGLITTDDQELADLVRAGRTYGYKAPSYDPLFMGLSARMQEFSAIIALHTLFHIEENLRCRRNIANDYRRTLKNLDGVKFQVETGKSSYNYFALTIDPGVAKMSAAELYKVFIKRGIEVKRYFNPPLHEMELYSDNKPFPNTEFVAHNNLTLPCYERLTDLELREIIGVLEECLS